MMWTMDKSHRSPSLEQVCGVYREWWAITGLVMVVDDHDNNCYSDIDVVKLYNIQ